MTVAHPPVAEDDIAQGFHRLDTWIERQGGVGWDPHDALRSPILHRLARNNRFAGIALVQLLRRSPVNLRRLLGVRKGINPKSIGLFLATSVRRYEIWNDATALDQANAHVSWLATNASSVYPGHAWGYHFDWPNRGFSAPAGMPTVVNTAFIGLALLDAGRLPVQEWEIPAGGRGETLPRTPLDLARSACDFIQQGLSVERPAPDEACLTYTPIDRRLVHNANVVGAWLLAEVGSRTQEPALVDLALACARYTARRQRPGGWWPYGEARRDQWADNFHTGYVLVGLRAIAAACRTDEFRDVVGSGYQFWKEHFFRADGAPKYYPNSLYPIDAHCVAQAILTFLAFAEDDSEAFDSAERVARWSIREMQDPAGFFYYQKERFWTNKIPYLRWSQAWMQRALIELIGFQRLHQVGPTGSGMELA